MKGIRGDFDETEILEELKSLNLPETYILKVKKLIFNRNDPSRYHFIIQLEHNSNPKRLISVRTLLYQRIKWERLRRMPIFQCKKCQRVGHSSANCNLRYRCIKCAKSHEPGQCQLSVNAPKEHLKCANCKEFGHPASYKDCPFLRLALDLKMKTTHTKDLIKDRNLEKARKLIKSFYLIRKYGRQQ
ncbi:hypothetical protein KPH14_011603 [Odynerus spinipes]|uniref:Nucleic-acid-binding protein from transposon X-element n=1 Tax=Odynerus spinipes TaxID=1348599 RepID=A0AAD9RDK4_9HYME|nr:hypothetical protein KPH14_011603 [Odynerus spinipes]